MSELNRSDSPFLHPIYTNNSKYNKDGTLRYDKEAEEISFDGGFALRNDVNGSTVSLNTKSVLSLGQTESSKSIYTYYDNRNVADNSSLFKGLAGPEERVEEEEDEEEDILSSFIDINKLQNSIDEFVIDLNPSKEVSSEVNCQRDNNAGELSPPISFVNIYNKSWTNVPNIPTTKVVKPRSLPPKSPIRASASSHTLRQAISSEQLQETHVLRPASPSMAQAAARLAASNLKTKSKEATVTNSSNNNNNKILATVSAAHAMGNSNTRDQKTLRRKQRQRRNQTFQHWMTTFQKEEPKPAALNPQVYKRIDEGLMNFQVDIKPIQDENQK